MTDYQALAGPVLIVFFAVLGGLLMGWALREWEDDRGWRRKHPWLFRRPASMDHSDEPTGI